MNESMQKGKLPELNRRKALQVGCAMGGSLIGLPGLNDKSYAADKNEQADAAGHGIAEIHMKSDRVEELRKSNLWLFSVWIVSPDLSVNCRPATENSISRCASKCISTRAKSSFQRATWRKLPMSIEPSNSRLIRCARLRLILRT